MVKRKKTKSRPTQKPKKNSGFPNPKPVFFAKKPLSPIHAEGEIKLRKQVQNLSYVFNPSSIAIVGASRNPSKIGNAILRNLIHGGYSGQIYPINPNADIVENLRAYPSLSQVGKKIDCAIICIHAKDVPHALQQAAGAKIPSAVIISGGFAEIGNVHGEMQIKQIANKHDMAVIGPNCMGVLNPQNKVDSVFLPLHKMGRPGAGSISFISQSGAVGGCIVDLAGAQRVGMAKFISYGNGTVINETDLLSYLMHDEKTKSIISYIEGVNNGREFMHAASSLTRKKPLVVLKAGKTSAGSQAARSHTASLSGSAEVFSAAMEQCGAIQAQNLEELFDLAKIFEIPAFLGSKIAVLTNGGGNGVLAADAIEREHLRPSIFSAKTIKQLKKILPPTAHALNPLDIIGDADSARYEACLQLLLEDENVDAIVAIALMQTASLDSSIVNVIARAAHSGKKPIIVVSTGGEYTQLHKKILDDYGVPTFDSPSSAISALAKALKYNIYKHTKP
ncbi:CoA-binding protein [Candidatus Micrarchaeota archaeon CG10_big_fil_rev_8_21_14_0_10_45_29]|nr:MAG: CoA-binding protein [Candidatus Micrarchaeota archaeon CG10_big_fil_rev_8_21_14_0_10_45_29]